MLFFKHMNRFLNFINALQCLVRYLPFNLSRLISLNSRSKEKRLTIYICVYLYIYIYIDIHIYSYSLWLSPQQLVEMNTKCINLFILQDTKWQLKDFFSLFWLNFHIQALYLDMLISPKWCQLYLRIRYEIDSGYIHFILLVCLIRLPISEETSIFMSNDHFYQLFALHIVGD